MPKKILIVEDEVDIVDSMKHILERRGYAAATALNGIEGLQQIKKEKPDLIITDVLMPEMDGYAFYKMLKKDPVTAKIPVLIVTARGQMEDTFKVVGADGFIHKPFSPDGLCSIIEQILSISELQRQPSQSADAPQRINKILIVAKEQNVIDDLTIQGQKAGYQIMTAHSGADAISKTVQTSPDMVIIDIQLDDVSSSELVDVLRRLPKFGNKPIIGYSYYDTEKLNEVVYRQKVLAIDEASQRFLQAGGTEYVGRYNEYNILKAINARSS